MPHVEVTRVSGDFGFEGVDASNNRVRMDSTPEIGGKDFGVRPMQMLLMGLGGCSGIDIVSILKKQKQEIKSFKMYIEGDRVAGKEPSLWTEIKIIFEVGGQVDPEKLQRACALSIDKYCSVAQTLMGSGTKIEWTSRVLGQQ